MDLILWFMLEKVVLITYNFLIAIQFFQKYKKKRDKPSFLFFLSVLLYGVGFLFSLVYAIRIYDGYNSIYAIVGGICQLVGAYLIVEFVLEVFYPKKSFKKRIIPNLLLLILIVLSFYAFYEYSSIGKSIVGSYAVVIIWLLIYSALTLNLRSLIKQVKKADIPNKEIKLQNLQNLFRFSIAFLGAVFLIIADSLFRTDLSVPTIWGFLGYIPIMTGLAYLSTLKE